MIAKEINSTKAVSKVKFRAMGFDDDLQRSIHTKHITDVGLERDTKVNLLALGKMEVSLAGNATQNDHERTVCVAKDAIDLSCCETPTLRVRTPLPNRSGDSCPRHALTMSKGEVGVRMCRCPLERARVLQFVRPTKRLERKGRLTIG